MIYPIAVICIFYCILILYFIKGFNSLESQNDPDYSSAKNSFSILIPFRNEEQHLSNLLQSLSRLDYPEQSFEIVMINDESSDKSVEIIEQATGLYSNLNLVLLDRIKTGTSPKKEAIEQGIHAAQHEWIITTDADCTVPKNWLLAFDKAIEKQDPNLLVAPVTYKVAKGFLHKFQSLDFISLQGITMGMFGLSNHKNIEPFLCNGANLCYRKKSFLDVNGFSGNKDLASGDDVFLLEKMQTQFPEKVHFLKAVDAIVYTSPKHTFNELIQQRVRWASKTSAYKHPFSKLVGLLVFLTNLSLITGFVLGLRGNISWLHFGFIFLLKFNVDFILLYKTSDFFEQKELMQSYFMSSLLYPFFTVLVVLLSFKNNFTWKERRY
ncbi:glycosyltransferase family 2 protein [Lutimonas sp.]|uniref:glycosyltransferase family 2 protein n=1 Tax=Lutimonas sp. TaxID=1872403 RepID=UPI003D9B4F9B